MPKKYPPEVCDQAVHMTLDRVHMTLDRLGEYESVSKAAKSLAPKLKVSLCGGRAHYGLGESPAWWR